jgi:hypothetical protein
MTAEEFGAVCNSIAFTDYSQQTSLHAQANNQVLFQYFLKEAESQVE